MGSSNSGYNQVHKCYHWAIADRNGYASCHGGQKRYNLAANKSYVASVFGLSGSGKSTITHAKHGGKYDITVLHDDAFIINTDSCSSIAMEPTYFDKTNDYCITIPFKEAYGEYLPEGMRTVSKDMFFIDGKFDDEHI